MQNRVLLIGEFITNKGYGLLGDTITTAALGGTPVISTPSITCVSEETTTQSLPIDFTRQQLRACFTDPGVDAVKLGSVVSGPFMKQFADCIVDNQIDVPIVFNPIISSESREVLITKGVLADLQQYLYPITTLMILSTQDIDHFISGKVSDRASIIEAAGEINRHGPRNVYVTGTIPETGEPINILVSDSHKSAKYQELCPDRTQAATGTWALSSAIATFLSRGLDLQTAIAYGHQFVNTAFGESSENLHEDFQRLNLIHTIGIFQPDTAQTAPWQALEMAS
ncbi:MAG: bifunctional hydroxymethylpyrimidine kinase/phosphomethylpyrimidine kinase [Alphaproteobacteria bacterium]